MDTNQTHSLLNAATDILGKKDGFRVWSVIVTLFGDLARNKDDQISGALLTHLMESMGIRPQATRVALHRLRKDEWISSQKFGRTVRYSLTETGFAQSLEARSRIYNVKPTAPENWHILIAQPMPQARRIALDQSYISKGYLNVSPGVLLGKGKLSEHYSDFLGLEGDLKTIPNWLKSSCAPADITQGYDALCDDLAQFTKLLESHPTSSPHETAALRILIIHNWRRLLLRHADLPAEFYPDDWPGLMCRRLVMGLLDRLKRPPLPELQS